MTPRGAISRAGGPSKGIRKADHRTTSVHQKTGSDGAPRPAATAHRYRLPVAALGLPSTAQRSWKSFIRVFVMARRIIVSNFSAATVSRGDVLSRGAGKSRSVGNSASITPEVTPDRSPPRRGSPHGRARPGHTATITATVTPPSETLLPSAVSTTRQSTRPGDDLLLDEIVGDAGDATDEPCIGPAGRRRAHTLLPAGGAAAAPSPHRRRSRPRP